jgi:glycine cleavage system H protein
MSNVPERIWFSRSHEWVRHLENGNCLVGITDHAQQKLTDVVFVNLADAGTTVGVHGAIGDVESIKAVSEVFSPLAGRIVSVNQAVLDDPSLINTAPYESWLVEITDITEHEPLLNREEYAAHCKSEE